MHFDIAAGKQRGQLAGKQECVGAGDVQVHVVLDEQTVEDVLEAGKLLDLVEEDIVALVRDQG